MAYWQWGDPAATHVVVCVHGLTPGARLRCAGARLVRPGWGTPLRVVCPDVVGRGQSDWLKDPQGLSDSDYAGDMLALAGATAAQHRLDWVGTSMGGLIGMVVCGQPDLPLPVPVRRLVLNDVGPTIRVGGHPAHRPIPGRDRPLCVMCRGGRCHVGHFQQFWPAHAEQWLALSRPCSNRWTTAGRLTLHYDPAIAVPFAAMTPNRRRRAEAMLVAAVRQHPAARCWCVASSPTCCPARPRRP
jgi:pimeloyl-ACP methyl ester carboxylesterase